ncbi:MAG: RloB domain-containing protein [Deltaproteobacteria bacterium]|nr:RloB domain-containing protein [Deltaproteobacteria bacterium]
MALTTRLKRPLDRRSRPEPHRDARLFVIATEGEETEKQYFSMFRNKRCQVKIIASLEGRSAPKYVLEQLKKFKKEYQLKGDDELWLMIDVDRWPERELAAVSSQSAQNNFFLAVSNPCFEIWLYLHHASTRKKSISSVKMKQILRDKLGSYNSSNLDLSQFAGKVEKAIARAKKLDIDVTERWPSSTGTHVYKVVKKIK